MHQKNVEVCKRWREWSLPMEPLFGQEKLVWQLYLLGHLLSAAVLIGPDSAFSNFCFLFPKLCYTDLLQWALLLRQSIYLLCAHLGKAEFVSEKGASTFLVLPGYYWWKETALSSYSTTLFSFLLPKWYWNLWWFKWYWRLWWSTVPHLQWLEIEKKDFFFIYVHRQGLISSIWQRTMNN